MKRDMDLVREILLAVEASPSPSGLDKVQIEGRSDVDVAYHVGLLVEAGLVRGIDMKGDLDESSDWMSLHLTMKGHDFLGDARDNTIWTQARMKIGGAVGSTSLAILQAMLTKLVMQRLGLE